MRDQPLVSVIVPAYNHELFVCETLRSLMAQTYQNLELIIVDDGSTDETYARISELQPELQRRFDRAEIGTTQNKGSARTISRCLELVRSDLVYMLDSDDVAAPDAVERLLPLMTSSDVALAVGDNEYIDAHGRPATLQRDGRRHSSLLSYHIAQIGRAHV